MSADTEIEFETAIDTDVPSRRRHNPYDAIVSHTWDNGFKEAGKWARVTVKDATEAKTAHTRIQTAAKHLGLGAQFAPDESTADGVKVSFRAQAKSK